VLHTNDDTAAFQWEFGDLIISITHSEGNISSVIKLVAPR